MKKLLLILILITTCFLLTGCGRVELYEGKPLATSSSVGFVPDGVEEKTCEEVLLMQYSQYESKYIWCELRINRCKCKIYHKEKETKGKLIENEYAIFSRPIIISASCIKDNFIKEINFELKSYEPKQQP